MKVSNAELIEELIKSKTHPTERLWMIFYALVKNYARKFFDREYEDIIQDATLSCILSRNKFDTSLNSSAFSYFTSLTTNVIYQTNLKRNRRIAYNNRVRFDNNFEDGIFVMDELDYEFEKFLMTRKRQKSKVRSN